MSQSRRRRARARARGPLGARLVPAAVVVASWAPALAGLGMVIASGTDPGDLAGLAGLASGALAFGAASAILASRRRRASRTIAVVLGASAVGAGASALAIGATGLGAPATPLIAALGVAWMPGWLTVVGALSAALLRSSRPALAVGVVLALGVTVATWLEAVAPGLPRLTAPAWIAWAAGALVGAAAVLPLALGVRRRGAAAARRGGRDVRPGTGRPRRSAERRVARWLLAAQAVVLAGGFASFETLGLASPLESVSAAVLPAGATFQAAALLLAALALDPGAGEARAARIAVHALLVTALLVVYAAAVLALAQVTAFAPTTAGVVAVAALALAADPVRRGLQRAVDGLVYGRSADPGALLRAVSEEVVQAPEDEPLRSLADALRSAFRVGGVSIRSADPHGPVAHSGLRTGAAASALELVGPHGPSGRVELRVEHDDAIDARTVRALERISGILEVALRLAETLHGLADAQLRLHGIAAEERRFVRAELDARIRPVLSEVRDALRAPAGPARTPEPGGPSISREGIDDAARRLQAVTAEVRDLARTLLPGALDAGDLRGALADLAERFPTPVLDARVDADAGADPAVYHLVAEVVLRARREHGLERIDVRVTARDGVRFAFDGEGGAVRRVRAALEEAATRSGTALVGGAADGPGGLDDAAGPGLRGSTAARGGTR